jgi:2-pyrone-4,6-dicarboxylate lactonase
MSNQQDPGVNNHEAATASVPGSVARNPSGSDLELAKPSVVTIGAPHPDPHSPLRFTPPPGACDAHCHIFGPGNVFPYSPDRSYTPPDSGIDDFELLQARLGLSNAVFVQASCHGTDNSAMLDALIRGQGRYAGVAMIDETFSDTAIQELHDAGVRSTRFNFVAHLGGAPELPVFWRIVERVAKWKWHIVLHFDAKDLTEYLPLLEAMPVPFVIDHMARVNATKGIEQEPFQALLSLMADERCWVKISGAERLTADGPPPYSDVVPYAQALIAAAPDRILWGTDWPHPNVRHMPDDGDLVDLLVDYAPDEATRNRILVDNPRRLYPLH